MNRPSARELCLAAFALAVFTGLFLLVMRLRLGPLQDNILIDAAGLIQQRPWMDFSGRELRGGFFPLWNPYTGFGQPHLANIQTAVFYPLNASIYLLGPVTGYNLWLLLRLWFGGFFVYLFLRRLKLDALPSFGGGLVWPLGGYGLWFMQLVELNSQLLLPLFLLSLHALADRPRFRSFIGAALIGWLVILGGHPEAIFNSWMIALLYFVFRLFGKKLTARAKLRRLVLAGAAGALSALLAAVVLLPFLNYWPRCWSLHYPGFGFFHLDIKTIGSLFLPGAEFSSRGSGRLAVELLGGGVWNLFKAGHEITIAPGVMPGSGIVVMVLALWGLLSTSRSRPEFGFFALFLVCLLGLTYGLAPFRWAAFVPPFSSASNYKFYYSEIYFCLSLMVALGISGISRGSKWMRPAALALLGLSLFYNSFTVKPYLKIDLKAMINEPWLKLAASKPGVVPPRIAVLGAPGSVLPPNLAILSGLNDISSSDALFPKAYFRLMDKLNGLSTGQRLDYFYPAYYVRPLKSVVESPLFDRYGINFVVSDFLSEAPLKKFSAWPRALAYIYDPTASVVFYSAPATVESYDSQRIEVTSPGNWQFLTLLDLVYPGWKARIGGKEVWIDENVPVPPNEFPPPFPDGFRTIDLPAGPGRIVFTFEPADFRVGLWLSLAGIIMVCAAWFLRGRNAEKA